MVQKLKDFFFTFIDSWEQGTLQNFTDLEREAIRGILREATVTVSEEPFVSERSASRVLVVGDTHGDLEASVAAFEHFLREKLDAIIFVGDYVDRGGYSFENLLFVALAKSMYPDKVTMLCGNHELFSLMPYGNATFWESPLFFRYADLIGELVMQLPLIHKIGGALIFHGGLPLYPDFQMLKDELNTFDSLEQLYAEKPEVLRTITWADFYEEEGVSFRQSKLYGRLPISGKTMAELKAAYGASLLIRGHQPDAKGVLFDGSLLTLLTSSLYAESGSIPGRIAYQYQGEPLFEDSNLIQL